MTSALVMTHIIFHPMGTGCATSIHTNLVNHGSINLKPTSASCNSHEGLQSQLVSSLVRSVCESES